VLLVGTISADFFSEFLKGILFENSVDKKSENFDEE
jgi:hypothetical protein